jgi:hypothetical protein
MMQLIEIPSSKRSSSEARLLLREYSNRINNEFASAIGAISVAAAHSANNEAKAVLAAVQDQLQNYAQAHHALQLPEHSGCINAAASERLGLFSSNKGEQTCSRYEEQPSKGGKHMSRTIEAVMRHMVRPAKREPARKASAMKSK